MAETAAPVRPRSATDLDTKYTLESGRVYLTGTQALARLPMMQRERDLTAGLNTAGFISGYRGSPLGALDLTLWKARRHLDAHHIQFQPGVNEDLAATAIWGTQQVNLFPGAKYDGVFGMWYGKGPGVDRCGDVFRHANAAGTSKFGGVLAVAGDDHAARSSTVAHQTEHALQGRHDAGAGALRRAGLPRPRPARLGDVALLRLLGGLQGGGRHHRIVGLGLCRSASRSKSRCPTMRCRRAGSTSAGRTTVWCRKSACCTTSSTPPWPMPAPTGSTSSSSTARTRASASSPAASPTSTCARPSTTSASTTGSPPKSASASTRSAWCGRSSPKACGISPRGWRRSSSSRKSASSSSTS